MVCRSHILLQTLLLLLLGRVGKSQDAVRQQQSEHLMAGAEQGQGAALSVHGSTDTVWPGRSRPASAHPRGSHSAQQHRAPPYSGMADICRMAAEQQHE